MSRIEIRPDHARVAIISAALTVATLTAALGILQGCGPRATAETAPVVAYAAQLEACLATSTTCEQYVACRHRVQTAHDQPLSGSCAEVTP